jgi:hypothetical protein
MKKRLSLTLVIITFGLTLIAPIRVTVGTENNLINTYDCAYTFDVEHGNYRSTQTLYTYIPPSLYDYYRSETHHVSCERDYAKFVTPDAFITIAENMRKITSNGSNSDEDFANDVLALVRQIPYSVSACKYPVEAIVANSGDCDVLSFLVASIMKAGGLDVVLLVYRGLPGSHMNVGIYLPYKPLSAPSKIEAVGFEFNNKTYWVAECTPSGNWKVGHQPESFAYAKPTIISLENQEETSPALISSSLNSPLIPSFISITLSLDNSTATEKERQLKISGSISPAHSGKKVVMYVSQDRSSSKVFQTDTDQLGDYSLTWNVTSTGTYYIRTNLITFSNYAGSDSELLTFFVGSYPPWVGVNGPNYDQNSDNTGYKTLSSKSVKEFLKSNLEGTNISLSGEFIVLKNEQTTTSSKRTITIPERAYTIIFRRRQRIIPPVPQQTVTVQGSKQPSNQFGFILQNNSGNYSANVRLMSDSDVAQIEKQFSENNSTFMNASTSIKENIWHNVVVKVSEGEITAELRDENDTLLKDFAVKEETTGNGECGILISCTPDTFVAFKNLKVENLDQLPNKAVGNIQPSEGGLELLVPYIMVLMLLGIVGAAVTYLGKERLKGYKKAK